jgi:hypothetical protein
MDDAIYAAMDDAIRDKFVSDLDETLENALHLLKKYEGECMDRRIKILLDEIEPLEVENRHLKLLSDPCPVLSEVIIF